METLKFAEYLHPRIHVLSAIVMVEDIIPSTYLSALV